MKTEKMKSEMDQTRGDRLGIKGLSKGKRKKLEAYQHLFYLLQVIKELYPAHPRCSFRERCLFDAVQLCLFIPFRQTQVT